jgi:cell division protein FtsQ
LPRPRSGGRLELDRLAPSAGSIVVGLVLVVLAGVSWLVARTTPLFAVDTIAVHGAPMPVSADVRGALTDAEDRSLLALDLAALTARVEALPTVASARLDRAFPHTLGVAIVPERGVAVLRQGARSWLASGRGRVMGSLTHGARPVLPRVWLGRAASVRVGSVLTGEPAAAVRAVAPLADASLPLRVASVKATAAELTLKLRSGLEVRLGDDSQLPLKLAVTAKLLPVLAESQGYLDVAVPERPVASQSLDSQVEVEVQASTLP